jgi:ABC-type phosphate/phosphonate transport system substrate-binding protein
MDQSNNAQIPAEIEEVARAHGAKLGALIADSTMPDDVKEALVALLPEMSLEEIERLENILEAKYLDEQTRSIDAEYKEKIASLVEAFKKEEAEAESKELDALKHLEAMLEA